MVQHKFWMWKKLRKQGQQGMGKTRKIYAVKRNLTHFHIEYEFEARDDLTILKIDISFNWKSVLQKDWIRLKINIRI